MRNAREDEDFGGRIVDYVDINWDQRRPTLKTRSRSGEEVRVLLPRGQTLRHRDVLFEDHARVVVINVLPCELIVVRSTDPRLMAEMALELGNLHRPTQVTETELIFEPDPEAVAAAQRLGLEIGREVRQFDPSPMLGKRVNSTQPIQILRPEKRATGQ